MCSYEVALTDEDVLLIHSHDSIIRLFSVELLSFVVTNWRVSAMRTLFGVVDVICPVGVR